MLDFLRSVFDEAKRLQMPTRRETYVTVITILVSVTIVALVIMFADFIISKIVKILFGLGA